ncbi:MAG: hypothetical protein DI551_00815 [Micavibrio aeruginosavorus]|uniref:DUF502 domain-containing protein n=1 Tax=Micavibrio aeruginosavorus TaxID=349221 RepID=A0A2W5Q2B3_9BACT|nr:MAG: hypothetical protein DI551_00815 [Micavibrio aeruginosavorus]
MTEPNPIAQDVEEALSTKAGFGARLRRYFFTGIVVTVPITITLWSAWWFLNFVDRIVAEIVPPEFNPNTYLPFSIPGLGLILTVVFFIVIGFSTRNFIGSLLIRSSEFIVGRMPILNTVYNALKQVFEMTIGAQSTAFRDVVLFQYPHPGSWTIGFVTGITPGEIQSVGGGSEVLNIYSPVTPTTAGFVVFIPKKDVIYLSMSIEDAVKLLASGGIIVPPVSRAS